MTHKLKDAHQDEHFYDIIGDVHGHLTELQKLLIKLEYSMVNGVWSHAYRTAVFVGDFINRGSNSKGVIHLIKDMVNAGTALAILGNHELNAILYFTQFNDEPIRLPGNNNLRLLERFANEYNGHKEVLKRDIKWLRTLPLHLTINGIRVVHAYWNDENLSKLDSLYEGGKLKKRSLKAAMEPSSEWHKPLFETLKGIELAMPKDLVIKDSQNVKRENFRIKWWRKPKGKTFKKMSYGNKFELPDYTIPLEIISDYTIYPKTDPIVFIGHYCMGHGPMIPSKNICCVDACVTGTGRLAAYRYNGEGELNEENFVFVSL
ncbi:metallophosphoesterase [Carboxylicivirga marina]|uniref:metallophosphoesterase n=1 Tax=Carboxylicivirga marina TaxID=2800988 RepID=UPI0025915715|nr:metallophosphoesterase [uncultured Carboxylicivirga sp.]